MRATAALVALLACTDAAHATERLCALLAVGEDGAPTVTEAAMATDYDELGATVLEAFLEAPPAASVACAVNGALLRAAHRGGASDVWRGAVSDVACAAAEVLLASLPGLGSGGGGASAAAASFSAPVPRGRGLTVGQVLTSLAAAQQALAAHAGPWAKGTFLGRAAAASAGLDPAPAKNWAYWLEQRTRPAEAASALDSAAAALPAWDFGLALQRASLCPPHFSSGAEATATHALLVARLDGLLADLAARARVHRRGAEAVDAGYLGSPLRYVGSLPIAWPYLGFPVRPLHERLGRAYRLAGARAGVAEVLVHASRQGPAAAAAGVAASPASLDGAASMATSSSVPEHAPSSTAEEAHAGVPAEMPAMPGGVQRLRESLSVDLRRTETAAGPQAGGAQVQPRRSPPSSPSSLLPPLSLKAPRGPAFPGRRVVLGVVAEAAENTSPGVLAGGWLAALPKGRFEVVWFELDGLDTPFSRAMRARADRTITLVQGASQPRDRTRFASASAAAACRRQGSAGDDCSDLDEDDDDLDDDDDEWGDPLFVARRAVASEGFGALLYLALGLTPFPFLLAQVRKMTSSSLPPPARAMRFDNCAPPPKKTRRRVALNACHGQV
jgi:hypothetical protein